VKYGGDDDDDDKDKDNDEDYDKMTLVLFLGKSTGVEEDQVDSKQVRRDDEDYSVDEQPMN